MHTQLSILYNCGVNFAGHKWAAGRSMEREQRKWTGLQLLQQRGMILKTGAKARSLGPKNMFVKPQSAA